MNAFLGRFRIGRDQNQVCRLQGHETEQKCVAWGEAPEVVTAPKVVYVGAGERWGIPHKRNSKPPSLHGRGARCAACV